MSRLRRHVTKCMCKHSGLVLTIGTMCWFRELGVDVPWPTLSNTSGLKSAATCCAIAGKVENAPCLHVENKSNDC
jgi:hypothetical protein